MQSEICTFCQKTSSEVFWLIACPEAMICDECIDLSAMILREKRDHNHDVMCGNDAWMYQR